MKYGTPGSVSSGTMASDLIPDFAWELARLHKANGASNAHHAGLLLDAEAYDPDTTDQDTADAILDELFDALNDYAPPYFYFGANEGDGEDYGFWLSPSLPQEFDGLKLSDLADIPDDYSGSALVINDHGNMSLYTVTDGKTSEVWAIV